jgi:hypothetical protein
MVNWQETHLADWAGELDYGRGAMRGLLNVLQCSFHGWSMREEKDALKVDKINPAMFKRNAKDIQDSLYQ